jgi:hypothetical protein
MVTICGKEQYLEPQTELFKDYRGSVIITEPVLTETVYLLGPSVKAQLLAIEFILRGGATLIPQPGESLARAAILMKEYADIPMGFADATLVVLAEEADVDEVFTLDLRGFNSYRLHGRRPFKIWPQPSIA